MPRHVLRLTLLFVVVVVVVVADDGSILSFHEYVTQGDGGEGFLQAIFQYIQDEHQDKKKAPLPDAEQWNLVPCTDDTPQQQNGVDCGVFTCMFADFVTKNCPLEFGQEHIDQCRDRIALSILQGKAIM